MGTDNTLDAVVVGAGVGGLYAIHRLHQLGYDLRAFEAGGGVGGTWFWNRYPGARCDIESTEYSFTFSEELQQEWDWTERFATQEEILRYIEHVADRFDLRRHITFDTRVTSAVYDAASNVWTVTTDGGEIVRARYCFMATGPLSHPQLPKIDGLADFEGRWHHTARWPREEIDFSGLRVGIIGTGSSGIQIIPEIARQAEHLYVFQRTAQYSVPSGNRPLTREELADVKANYRELRQKSRYSRKGNIYFDVPDRSAHSDSDEVRRARYDAYWNRGGLNFLYSYDDLVTDVEANATAAAYVEEKIRAKVKDPVVADALTPKDHYLGTKRPCSDAGYYETFNRDNVTLVDLRKAPIERIVSGGIKTAHRAYDLDVIIFATGFDALTGAILNIDIRVEDGPALADLWQDGPRAYLGMTVAGFPNLFFLAGPGSPSVLANVILVNEQQVDWLIGCLIYARETGFDRIEADAAAQEEWTEHVRSLAEGTLFMTANSWYLGANVPGKPRVFLPYMGGLGTYRQKCENVAANGYAELKFSCRASFTA